MRAEVPLALAAALAGCNFSVHGLPLTLSGADGGAAVDLAVGAPGALGAPCTSADACDSGFCVDGVCCESACDPSDPASLCKACDVAGSEGHCVAAAAGSDPRDQCDADPVASCGRDGQCDGSGACERWPAGTACGTSTCANGSITYAPACDGNGACVTPASMSCAPYVCANSTACATMCTPPANGCASPAVCTNGSCGTRAIGQPCSQPSDCTSNFCAQGVCCNSACTGSCVSCNVTGKVGTCTPEPAGTQCAAPTCVGDAKVAARVCDGAGTCQPPVNTDCTPYTCNKTTTQCYMRPCANSLQCAAGHTCNMGSHKCM